MRASSACMVQRVLARYTDDSQLKSMLTGKRIAAHFYMLIRDIYILLPRKFATERALYLCD
jgi:hypothetical protein